ncbi:hypothetical protein SAMN02745181_3018 [Rubritalea squalenifaciens DSM 18772]|uniref:Lipoprotein n=1 Tax=Rubritalea squalenifaciens DSM 18772 TaxID=1123071 RepID=A0A1M6NYV5_9BACT|nr:hypothetical protein [Rubritalea squalenifaciens]SHK00828.1 hypothetical protein SAMN02745181_3018 [Rubritalea squalenifaciens DSM 18772]
MRLSSILILTMVALVGCTEKEALIPESQSQDNADQKMTTPDAMPTAKEDAQALVDEFMPFAELMLTKHREFFPFGGRMSVGGEITHEGASDGTEQPPSQTLIDLLRQAHKQQAAKKEIRAACIVYDIRTIPPGKAEKQDVIAFELDHRDDYSVVVVFPYSFAGGGELQIEAPFASPGDGAIFAN